MAEIPDTMKSWSIYQLGGTVDDFVYDEIPVPKLTQPHDVLVRNYATSLNPTDSKSRLQGNDKLTQPKILGMSCNITVSLGCNQCYDTNPTLLSLMCTAS